ncbi:rho GTPase-activating protein 32-like, partial [Lagopus leucura]|uniref:rho GTPase-activating protein 32-like n=1 Tax=Lagopus leucura TaxID=30410 RepID=UPI001C6684F9
MDLSAGGQLTTDERRNLGSVAKMLQHAASSKMLMGDSAHLSIVKEYLSQSSQKFRKKSLMSVPRETYTALALPGRCGNWKFWGVLKRALSAFARGRTEQSDKKQLRVQGIVYLVLISCQFQLVVPAVMGVACSEISCGPDMTRMEAENNGKPLLVREESSLNIPAIAAAHVIKRYVAQAPGELSLEVGDLVCVIDMPPQELSPRWRGKHGFQVGFFPGECVELINGKIPESLINSVPKP